MKTHTFMDRALAGEILDLDLDLLDCIDRWHADLTTTLSLHDWLGMTQAEYERFVESPWALADILTARQDPRISWCPWTTDGIGAVKRDCLFCDENARVAAHAACGSHLVTIRCCQASACRAKAYKMCIKMILEI